MLIQIDLINRSNLLISWLKENYDSATLSKFIKEIEELQYKAATEEFSSYTCQITHNYDDPEAFSTLDGGEYYLEPLTLSDGLASLIIEFLDELRPIIDEAEWAKSSEERGE